MIKLANVSDVPEGGCITVPVEHGQEIALFKIKGEIFALNNACPHMGGPLNEGEIEGCLITCPWHGWQFDVKNGTCVNMPGEEAETIPIVVQDGVVYLQEKQ